MKFNPFTKAESLTDEDLDAIAAEDEGRKAALLERERRAKAKTEAAEEEARQKAEAERRRKVAELLREHERHAAEAKRAHDALGAAVLAGAEALAQREAARWLAWAVADQVVSLGEPRPAPALPDFPREAQRAAIALAPVLSREFTERFDPRARV